MRPYTLPKQFQPLTPDQLAEINDWLVNFTYQQIRQKLLDTFQIKISNSTLCRYQQNRDFSRHLIDREEDGPRLHEFLAILNGQPVPYDQTGIALIQKRAFDLACAPNVNAAKLNTLLRIFHYQKNCDWTERRLAQKDQRIEISERCAKIKEAQRADRRASVQKQPATPTPTPIPGHVPIPTNYDEIRARVRQKFG